MSESTVVFINGVARGTHKYPWTVHFAILWWELTDRAGIGRGLAEAYLSRPNHVVIGSVRDTQAKGLQELKDFSPALGSRLLLVAIESTSTTDSPKAVEDIKAAGFNHLDLVIANAGICPDPTPLETVDVEDIQKAFLVNTIGPVLLWKGLKPLLEQSKKSPKWLSVSTAAASLARLEVHQASFVPAYGITKAGFNWFTL